MTLISARSALTSDDIDFRDPRRRLAGLLDPGSLASAGPADGCGVTRVTGRVDGAEVVAFCTDATSMGGALGAAGADRIVEAIRFAVDHDRPVVGVWHCGGARLADGVESMDGAGRMFRAMTAASGRVPQISVVVGPAAGAAAYGPALTDFIVMSDAARVFVTGPDVVRAVTGETIDMAGLGGPEAHGPRSGVAHLTTGSEADAYRTARALTGYLARPGAVDLGAVGDARDPAALLPGSSRRAYNVLPLLDALLDPGTFLQIQPRWGRNMAVGLGRLAGRSIGVVANNPLYKGGCLDSLSAEKAARFVRTCDCLGVPLLVVVDVPGYLPGVGQEWGGVVRRGAKLLYAFSEAVVPRITLITRKSYGGAYLAMNSRPLGGDAVFAWPDAEVAVMGAEAAVDVLHRRALAAADAEELPALRSRLVEEQRRNAGGLDRALSLGAVDEVVAPADTRRRLAQALHDLPARRGTHGNIPL
ncbi:carboxyl transferase domain-containing protein [Streptantibioticus cattleyicolor]|uniref:Carboxyl transferase n=1 Tax=Streptantibioticus cattleyicolor (strain ATCC 35852 / DSM 46488 / JCM 4925 / NBRC 14057 / NRRL 8057) TaxID=1003195 RepID=F8JL02_STREN|nr:carboxyl transferase domain-containing protein [Streptantibioticus cattleyicolor]AEW99637.1 carboxyl transferase [Streptantibioticus cattleyicolor NRRL 8057 = DSM 46488]CCB71324.1 putative propionyl-CoA carboxylase beta chain 6 [Streptantibioticus cattleyicolor NRRL 8057 = DSM 46488]